jgi:outer membrane receptor protein involved in Fe transport
VFQTNQDKRSLRSALLLGAASAAVAGLSVPASAQETTETVVVTGSRIPQAGLYSTSPVTAVGQQEFKYQGATNVESLLRQLPAAVSSATADNSTANNGSGGEENVDLRGLGSNRTLVLVDGKRLVPADAFESVDLSIIPPTMVDHIEVLTGGASAIYGADAVAGVVNVILRKNFEGMEVDGSFTATGQGGGGTKDVNAILGFNSANGKGNITIYGDYTDRDALFQSQRALGKFALHDGFFESCRPGVPLFFGGFCRSGSSLIQEGLDFNTGLMFTPDRTAVPYDGRTYNFAPLNYYQTPDTRYTFGAEGHYEVDKMLDFYTRLTFADHVVTTQLAPTPILSPFLINYGNPLISAQEKQALFVNNDSGACDPALAGGGVTGPTGPNGTFLPGDTCQLFLGRRLVGNGNRVTNFEYAAYQIVIGARGDLAPGWSYDISAQYGHTLNTQRLSGDASAARFQQGLLVNPDGTCQDPSGGCVPIDIFATDSITADQKNFFTLAMAALQRTEEWDTVGSVTGDLGTWGLRSPWAKDGVSVVGGGEYRQEKSRFMPDDNLQTGNLLGFGAEPAVEGEYNVAEGFGELRIPLVEDVPFVKALTVHGAYRYSSYNIEGSTNTYSYDAQWAPTEDFLIRASYQRAVRAPNVGELFSPQTVSQNPGTDPCSDLGATLGYTATQALCEATGVPAANYNTSRLECPSGQCTAVVGGNPNLRPELSDSRSIGVVLTPTFFDGFTATVDYYNIKVTGAVGPLGGSIAAVLQGCYDPAINVSQSPDFAFCQLVHRDSAGRIFSNSLTGGNVLLTNINTALIKTKGVDWEVNYQRDLADWGMPGVGSFSVNWVGTWLDSFQQQGDPTQPVYDCKGLFGDICGAPDPEWKHNLRLTWYSPDNDISISGRWRHLSSVEFDEVKINGFFDPISQTIPSFDYFDLSGTWQVHPGLELRAGIDNIFQKDPPPIDQGLAAANIDSGNTFPGTYDVLGRTFFVGATAKF